MPDRSILATPLPVYSGYGSSAWADVALAEAHLRDDCAAYSACSARAAAERWTAWSCRACDAYTRDVRAHRVVLPMNELVRGATGEVGEELIKEAEEDIERGTLEPELIVLAESMPTPVGPRHRVITPNVVLLAALRAGLNSLPCIPVGRGVCPACARAYRGTGRALAPVLTDGCCPVCRRHVDAVEEGDGFEYLEGIPSRAYLRWMQQREVALVQSQASLFEPVAFGEVPGSPAKESKVARAMRGMASAVKAVSRGAEQLGLLLDVAAVNHDDEEAGHGR